MLFNKEINALRVMLERENDRIGDAGGCCAASETVREIAWRICTLTDRALDSEDAFRAEVLRMTYEHDPAHFPVTPRNRVEEYRVGQVRKDFASELDRVPAGVLPDGLQTRG